MATKVDTGAEIQEESPRKAFSHFVGGELAAFASFGHSEPGYMAVMFRDKFNWERTLHIEWRDGEYSAHYGNKYGDAKSISTEALWPEKMPTSGDVLRLQHDLRSGPYTPVHLDRTPSDR